MPLKKLPKTDEERMKILQKALDQEDLNESQDWILSIVEWHEIRSFLLSFEGIFFSMNQTAEDEKNAKRKMKDDFESAQLYISHFIQVLHLAVIRNEVKMENLSFYGFEEGKEMQLPPLSTEEDILKWGDRLIKGESERTYRGGVPIYNPPIAKVKVHYDLFCESLHSLKIYQQNALRSGRNITDLREKADAYILDIWNRVEQKYGRFPLEERTEKYKTYLIDYFHNKGEQLDVFG